MKDPDNLTDRHTDNKPKINIGTVGMGDSHSKVILTTAITLAMAKRKVSHDEHMGFREESFKKMKEEAVTKKSDFSEYEEAILKSLHGKEKKKYVKELKEKYKKE